MIHKMDVQVKNQINESDYHFFYLRKIIVEMWIFVWYNFNVK